MNKITRYIVFFIVCQLLSFTVVAQNVFNLSEQMWLNKHIHSNKKEHFIIHTTNNFNTKILSELTIDFRKYGNIITVYCSPKKLLKLADNKSVKDIEIHISSPRPLNDTMLIHNNITPIHQGNSYLQSYKGKNVVLGFIDTGIDITHPDFKDSLGNSRIYRIWDQTVTFDGNNYGYGTIWTNTAIDNNICTHQDPFNYYGHGSQVSGTAAGNGSAVNNYTGVAPEAKIIMVASKFDSINWLATVVDAVDFIFKTADSLNLPCVINISAGDYYGSHDGKDYAATIIDSLVKVKKGRAIIAAAGNAGFYPFHIQHQLNGDSTFTWFQYNSNTLLGTGAVFFEVWADTADLNNIQFKMHANKNTSNYSLRGSGKYLSVFNCLNNTYTDTLKNTNGDILAVFNFYAELRKDRYLLQIASTQTDSSSYYFGFKTKGTGKLDIWAATWLGTSEAVSSVPSSSVYPEIVTYTAPDTLQTMVSSFSCLPSVITVGNFVNRKTYTDVNGNTVVLSQTPGEIAYSSSLGPTRTGFTKPDLTATGDNTLSSCPDTVIQAAINNGQSDRIAWGGKHKRNGGTSLAAPVVAGTVALLLEKCPLLSYSDIKNKLISTTKNDTFTGNNLPNPQWGFGKLNADSALKSTNFNVSLTANTPFCEGDTLFISTQNTYSDYLWNNSGTTTILTIFDTDTVWVETTDSSGCKGRSDTIIFTKNNRPPQPILTLNNDTLFATSGYINYNWELLGNGIIQSGSNNYVPVLQSGNYVVEITDSNGCKNTSDTLFAIANSVFQTANNNQLMVYPNPVNNKLIVNTLKTEITTIHLLNYLGETLIKKQVNSIKTAIDISHLPKGIYLLKIYLMKNSEPVFHKIVHQ